MCDAEWYAAAARASLAPWLNDAAAPAAPGWPTLSPGGAFVLRVTFPLLRPWAAAWVVDDTDLVVARWSRLSRAPSAVDRVPLGADVTFAVRAGPLYMAARVEHPGGTVDLCCLLEQAPALAAVLGCAQRRLRPPA